MGQFSDEDDGSGKGLKEREPRSREDSRELSCGNWESVYEKREQAGIGKLIFQKIWNRAETGKVRFEKTGTSGTGGYPTLVPADLCSQFGTFAVRGHFRSLKSRPIG